MMSYCHRAGLAGARSPAGPCSQMQVQVIGPIAHCRNIFLPPALLPSLLSATSATGGDPTGAKRADLITK